MPAVNCTIELEQADLQPDPLGVRTAVGETLARGSVALDPDATMGEALELIRSEDRHSIAIVDTRHVVIGIIHEAAFVTSASAGLPAHSDQEVTALMSGKLAIHESVPVRRALELLATAHLREVTVVDDEGVPLGVFRDVDGLRWLVGARGDSP